jgi:hypothetical protein
MPKRREEAEEPACVEKPSLAEDVFYFVEEGGAAFGWLVFHF